MDAINVVGAVIIVDGLVFCAKRNIQKELGGKWEFPGGKVKEGESLQEALVREIEEECGCEIQVHDQIACSIHEYSFGLIKLHTFSCQISNGTPLPIEHSEFRWQPVARLDELDWAPVDLETVQLVMSRNKKM